MVGILPSDFFSMTLWEINECIKIHNLKIQDELKTEFVKMYKLADMIRIAVKYEEFPDISEFFPDIFSERKSNKIKNSWLNVAKG